MAFGAEQKVRNERRGLESPGRFFAFVLPSRLLLLVPGREIGFSLVVLRDFRSFTLLAFEKVIGAVLSRRVQRLRTIGRAHHMLQAYQN